MQFCFSVCGLLSVLNSKIATISHMRLLNALLEVFAMHNPCLPLERALQSNAKDRQVYTRSDKQKKWKEREEDTGYPQV